MSGAVFSTILLLLMVLVMVGIAVVCELNDRGYKTKAFFKWFDFLGNPKLDAISK